MSTSRNDVFGYLTRIQEESLKKATSIGLLINSGGIVGILSYSGGKLTDPLKTAFLFFIASVVSLFIVEMISMITASRSIEQLSIETDTGNVDITKLYFSKCWVKAIRYFINMGAVASSCYALVISMAFITQH